MIGMAIQFNGFHLMLIFIALFLGGVAGWFLKKFHDEDKRDFSEKE